MPGAVTDEKAAPLPDYGRRSPPALLDELAATDPDHVLYSIYKSRDLEAGFDDVTYGAMANAVNRAAHWLKEKLGTSEHRTFCYMGPLDIRYMILVLAAPKAGHTAFFTSYRNSLEAHLSLVKSTKCTAFLLPTEPLPIVRQILDEHPLETISTPELSWFLDATPVDVIKFAKPFEEIRNSAFVMLHTSGSTGIPKPVAVTYGSYGGMDAQMLVPELGFKQTFLNYVAGKRVFLALPVFHAASLNWTTGIALFANVTCVLPPPIPLTADIASTIFASSNSCGAIMAPSLAIDCYNNDSYRAKMLANLDFICYGGGMLPAEIGKFLCKEIKLMTLMGSCETSLLPAQMLEDRDDWEYLSVSPTAGVDWRHERDGLYNLVLKRSEKLKLHQGVFSTFPEKTEHAMGDLFEPHPTRPDLWRFRARVDDIISFTTAEKLNPITMESVIQTHPLVRSAVVGGQGQFQASLLLEPREFPHSKDEEEAFLSAVWPSIAQANKGCPAHGRIMKGYVMLSDPKKPLPRASKDTVQRHQVFKLYEKEWKELYERLASQDPTRAPVEAATQKHIPAPTTSAPGNVPVTANSLITDELAQAIDQIVEQRVAAKLDQLVAALSAAIEQIKNGGPLESPIPVHVESTATPMVNGTNGVSKADHRQTNGVNGQLPSASLRKVIIDALAENLQVDQITDDANLFECGLDSLQVPPLLNAINSWILKSHQSGDMIKSAVIYDNPTVGKMIAAIL